MSNKCSTNPDNEGVSCRPSDYAKTERPPDIGDIRSFTPKGERDDIATTDLPLYCRRALETLGHEAQRPPSHVAVWALRRGLRRLRDVGDVRTICDARARLLAAGSEHIVQLDDWHYKVQARDGSKRLTLRMVEKHDRGRLLGLAAGMGLSQSTLGAIAIVFGLADAPLPGELPDKLTIEVRAFCDALRSRAAIARDVAARAAENPAEVRQRPWAEIVGED